MKKLLVVSSILVTSRGRSPVRSYQNRGFTVKPPTNPELRFHVGSTEAIECRNRFGKTLNVQHTFDKTYIYII